MLGVVQNDAAVYLFLSCAEIIELIHTSVLFFFIIAKVKEEKSYQDLVNPLTPIVAFWQHTYFRHHNFLKKC